MANDDEGWIALGDPAEIFEPMVPSALRFDESRIGLPDARTLGVCFDGDDRRKAFRTTLAVPNRWVCKLQVAYRDPETETVSYTEGSGLLIGDRFVLTAAHLLMDDVRDGDGGFLRAIDAAAVVVIPGLDGRGRSTTPRAAETMPFGWVRAEAFRTNAIYRRAMLDRGGQFGHLDYAVIRLATLFGRRTFAALEGARFGFWGAPAHKGRTRIRALEPAKLRNVKVNAAGYPSDKCLEEPVAGPVSASTLSRCLSADRSSTAWYAFDRIRSAGAAPAIFATLTLDHDLAPGMSGGPVWLRWRNVRTLIGVNHACIRSREDGSIAGSSAIRITAQVKRDIKAWTT